MVNGNLLAMKSLMFKIKKRLRSNRGETLVEAIISILLLAILMTTVTLMIQTSLRLTANSMQDAERIQNETFNPAIFNNHGDDDLSDGTITFLYSYRPVGALDPIYGNAKHDIQIFEDLNNIVSLYPDPVQNGG